MRYFILCHLVILILSSISIPNIHQLERTITQISRFSETHPCISRQISKLKPRCSKMLDSEKARTALALTNCILTQSKKRSYPCSQGESINDCLSQIQGDAWTSYSSFYIHVDSLCYYFTSLNWEERTSSLVNNLSLVSKLTHSTLESHLHQTQKMMDIQSDLSIKILDSLTLQKQLRQSMKNHQSDIEKMASGLQNTISNLEQNVNKHYRVVTEIFNSIDTAINKLSSVQTLLLGEIEEGIGSILYYFFILVSVFVLSVICKSVRQNFISNIVLILVSLGFERLMKFIGFGDSTWKIRFGVLLWMLVNNLLTMRKQESFQVKVLQKIQSLNESIEDKLGTARIKRIINSQQSAIKSKNNRYNTC